jgi:hypothetical protein
MNARLPRNSAIPAAAGPARPEKKHATAADTDRAVTDNYLFKNPNGAETLRAMTDYHALPELLEEYMQGHDSAGRWVTVPEFRTFFAMDRHASPAISGFFSRLYQGPFFTCPYRVARIEKLVVNTPHTRMIKRYFITRRPEPRYNQGACLTHARSYPQQ